MSYSIIERERNLDQVNEVNLNRRSKTMKQFTAIIGFLAIALIIYLTFTCLSLKADRDMWRDSFITLQVAVINNCDLETEHRVFAEFYDQQPKVYQDLGYIVP